MSNDLETGRQTPPEPHEWPHIWRKLERADSLSQKAWVIAGPFYAVVTNWKALCVVGGVALFLKGDDLLVFFAAWLGER